MGRHVLRAAHTAGDAYAPATGRRAAAQVLGGMTELNRPTAHAAPSLLLLQTWSQLPVPHTSPVQTPTSRANSS